MAAKTTARCEDRPTPHLRSVSLRPHGLRPQGRRSTDLRPRPLAWPNGRPWPKACCAAGRQGGGEKEACFWIERARVCPLDPKTGINRITTIHLHCVERVQRKDGGSLHPSYASQQRPTSRGDSPHPNPSSGHSFGSSTYTDAPLRRQPALHRRRNNPRRLFGLSRRGAG